MKKIIAIVALVLAGITAQAASFSWNTAATGVDSSGNTLTTGSIYAVLVWSVDGSSLFNGGTPTTGSRLPLDANDRVLDATTAISGSGTTGRISSGTRNVTWGGETYIIANPPAGVDTTPLFPSVGAAQALDFYMIVYNNTDMSAATQYQILSKVDVGGPATATTGMTLAFGTVTQAGWQPIPEPTSLALLAIGAAAIGLRRKFRK